MTDNEVKLPEPVAWLSQIAGPISTAEKKEAERLGLDRGHYHTPLFTADQLTAAVMAERERCARVCYAADKSTHPTDLGDAIRQPPAEDGE